ncbi:hypothetical protein HMPREF0326_01788 [Desulfovibrio sp. 3_1_syn3]|nr:hypothetical protein HMPREF0326_01788 [Desulfovibrio sp. 3_1_syn3]
MPKFELIVALISLLISFVALFVSYQTFMYKSHEDKLAQTELILPKSSNKIVPKSTLDFIKIGSALDSVKDILGSPFKTYRGSGGYFADEAVKDKVYLYSFKNVDIKIETSDGESVNVITVERGSKEHPINLPPFEGMALGVTTIGDMKEMCDFEKAKIFTSSKEIVFISECYLGNPGNYLYYSYGFYPTHGENFNNGKFVNPDGTEINIDSQLIDFYSIANDENRGTTIGWRELR